MIEKDLHICRIFKGTPLLQRWPAKVGGLGFKFLVPDPGCGHGKEGSFWLWPWGGVREAGCGLHLTNAIVTSLGFGGCFSLVLVNEKRIAAPCKGNIASS